MHLTVLQKNLQKALSFVGKNVSSRIQLPILANVLLQTETGRLKLSSTNLETTISFWIGADIETRGEISVPSRLFGELINSFSGEKAELFVSQSTLKVICGESEATLSGIDAKEFPPLPSLGDKKNASLNKNILGEGMPFVLSAASTDESRPLLTGAKFTKKDGKFLMVATDGYRLALKELKGVEGLGEGFVVSARALAEVYRLVGEENSENIDLYLSQDRNQIAFVLPEAQITTRLIEGEYPAYEKIIPSARVTQVVFQKQELMRAVKLAAVYAKESANILRLKIADKQVVISANTPQIGENKTTLNVETEGAPVEIAFNVRFLAEMLNVFPEEEVVMELNGALAPGAFKPRQDTSFLYIIMPVRVQE
ncbi:MAG: polymerase III subunit beta protein [Candidatus Gottesmanbacteria bacterium GW2011_GWB1_43_11]|uniref:Beta sliding clamp n=1 Tax=Candidatus Gottesmanbacteria bacterium GW2011_GWB1_43_11 TaxID=1618446 RepID=A0A0G1CLX4_9BACT|nr:MAG: polymerase III subunit beta protein [Candidatus Gottesmanbacteria bacterium GW2011_GWA2_42_16]KKS55857.1 MAG: polymerase III subunit beta protein [Candidatus Gottesmanbacteria bacterium GW2011_GWA1_42_26]KKS81258.1 MAG: polymerase III subunit beta protein [Candidatus Gottesmanbacteria bacterium GW2011_GWC1_43_10]KKS86760.1 MAG: polymerase III subunit beta protein [Candidatus Gottesmanbacteria bacterium GW2011_GWB1_43_11]OGG09847.1 MAG: DNA polymerase III subunit beta [Candidatus Gottesm